MLIDVTMVMPNRMKEQENNDPTLVNYFSEDPTKLMQNVS